MFLKTKNSRKKDAVSKENIDMTTLLQGVMETFQMILRTNIYETKFTKEELEERLEGKKQLRKALRTCTYGEEKAKTFVKDYIKDIVIKKYKLDEENIEELIPFSKKGILNVEDKFLIIMYMMSKKYKQEGLEKFILENQLEKPKKKEDGTLYYEISKEEIHIIYDTVYHQKLPFYDKINILVQKIYQMYKGNGIIDEIRDMKIDGVSAGVSGITKDFQIDGKNSFVNIPFSYDSVWIFFQGKSIHLSFLSFGNEKELIRVCKNIYRYGNQGQLSETRGYIVSEMMDGSRVSVARPPFSESWVLFVRKFDNIKKVDIQELIKDDNSQLPIDFIKWLIKGCQISGITGEQGAGKTTLLMAMIAFISPMYNLRVHELSFELNLRKIYPERNIVTFRETSTTSGQEGLDFSKKTDGTVSILGEVASAPVANWLVQMSMVASMFTLFTHHAKTTENLVFSLRNALLQEGGFQSERIAAEQVIDTINFDIHMKKSETGHRYIERITEIVPLKGKPEYESCENLFSTRDIIILKEGAYVFAENISKSAVNRINNHLSEKEKEQFRLEMLTWRRQSK